MSTLIAGKWYPENSSSQYYATLIVDNVDYALQIAPYEHNGNVIKDHKLTGQWSQVSINERLGNTERKLILADGSLFTTLDNDAIDILIRRDINSSAGSKWNLRLHQYETKMSSVLMMLGLTVVFAIGFVKWGIPLTSQAVAHALPQSTAEYIGKQSLQVIDRYFLQPTKLSDAEQQKISSRFETRLKPLGGNDNIHYQLHFREMNIGSMSLPNAFALPSGDIVLTDKFVELSHNDDEIDAVLLHEMGHVVERHSLEMLTQNSFTTMIVMLVLGNPDGISELATGLGTALVSNHYSRQYETEADEFAFKKMLEAGINPQAFVAILSRMEDYSTGDKENDTTAKDDSLSDFLSTHPNTQLRIEMANKYSKCFDQGLTVCD
ncbi:M48 family metallopeptidase [Psychrobacter sp.]|uniref:M48 family metallopeptidase n=1 Tax=Psychrobacter sp. TaxID=56811 RepID=UPI0025EF32C8|nr:M48 family metallopeptidase [Psychrobacter sp.]